MKIIDDILSESDISFLSEMVFRNNMDWYYRETIKHANNNPYCNSWGHVLFDNSNRHESYLYKSVYPVAIKLLNLAGEKVRGVERCRFNLNTITETPQSMGMHVDCNELVENPRTAILYINDSDGDTKIYKQRFEPKNITYSYPQKFELESVVEPKRNRIVCFSAYRFHEGITPTKNQRRILLNINYY